MAIGNAIYGFEDVVATTNKMLKVASILGCEVIATTQNAKALGPLVPEVDLNPLGRLHLGTYDKTLFSMLSPEVKTVLETRPAVNSIILFGIESHVCILQTALDLLRCQPPYAVHIIADGVSSCNATEIPFAFSRMRQAGAVISTSESIAFQLVADSARPEFKTFATLIKEQKDVTKKAGEVLLAGHNAPTAGNKSAL